MIRKFPPVLLAALIGIAAFVFYTGGAIVWPTSTEWLMRGDFGQHFLGWNFFRHTPLLQFPLGASREYGETLSSSIVFTDSTPLFAFVFKPFAAWLPEPFQYIGIWLALSVMLQGVFAYKLLSLFSKQRLTVLLATAFFVIAPPFWWRIYVESDALAAHWLILAALYLYFNPQLRWRGWLVLLSLAALTHAYLLAMVLAIWGADLLQRVLKKQISLRATIGYGLLSAASLGLVMWVAGYFMLHDGLSTPVGSYFRMSLLGLVDPLSWWSSVMPEPSRSGGEYEGFSYLGSGVLLLLASVVVSLSALLITRKGRLASGWRWATLPPLLPLFAAAVVLAMQAFTTHIGWGAHDVWIYRLPAVLDKFFGVFRVSGRMFWPVFYLIYVGVFCAAFKLIPSRWLQYLLGVLLILQLVDSNGATQNIRKSFREYRWTSPLQSAFWQQLPKVYRRIAVVMPAAYNFDYFPIALFASERHLSINHGYFARMDVKQLLKLQSETIKTVFAGGYDPQTLYVFFGDPLSTALSEQAKISAGPDDLMAEMDGYRILAPGWKQCAECQHLGFTLPQIAPAAAPEYVPGTEIRFGSGGNAARYLAGGWSHAEEWGNWTYTNAAALRLAIPGHRAGDLMLDISAHAFVPPSYPRQTVQVSVNGHPVGELHYTARQNQSLQSLRIPAAVVAHNHGELLIVFSIAELISPIQATASKDIRSLGLGAMSMVIH